MRINHRTISGYRRWAASKGWLDTNTALPEARAIDELLRLERSAAPAQNTSSVKSLHDVIAAMVDQDMEAMVIHQRLTQAPHCFKGSYHAVYRYIRKHFKSSVEATACIRIETKPGEEAQVDFGYAGLMWDPVGKPPAAGGKRVRRTWVFVMTLSWKPPASGWSRHQYVVHAFDQSVSTWLDCHGL